MARDLISELLQRKKEGQLNADQQAKNSDFSPLKPFDIKKAEKKMGVELPEIIRRVYRDVANGGFGPSYGILGLIGGLRNEDKMDAVSLYQAHRRPDPKDKHWNWPIRLLPLGNLGCGMYLCADCSLKTAPMIWFEPNPHVSGESWEDSFFRFAASFEEWMFAWLDGKDLFAEIFNDSPDNRIWKKSS